MDRPEMLDWLLEGDPSIRWQVLRDLLAEPEEVWASVKASVATDGWGARLLDLQDEDGRWDGGVYNPGHPRPDDWADDGQPWTGTLHTLSLLRELGLDADTVRGRTAIDLVEDGVVWDGESDGVPFLDGETEPCVNGQVVSIAVAFGRDPERLVDRLVDEQLEDGGWNCDAERGSTRGSFHSTICVLDGLLAAEREVRAEPPATLARRRGEEYLLERRLLRRASTGEVIDETWRDPVFPPRWHYDVLRGLDHIRQASIADGTAPDARCAEAVEILLDARGRDGRWVLPRKHIGRVAFPLETVGAPSRWITLRALRVLDWWNTR